MTTNEVAKIDFAPCQFCCSGMLVPKEKGSGGRYGWKGLQGVEDGRLEVWEMGCEQGGNINSWGKLGDVNRGRVREFEKVGVGGKWGAGGRGLDWRHGQDCVVHGCIGFGWRAARAWSTGRGQAER